MDSDALNLQTRRFRRGWTRFAPVCNRLAASDPANAAWQRDLWVSCWRWRMAHDTLAGMKQRGLFVSTADEGFLAGIREKLVLPTE